MYLVVRQQVHIVMKMISQKIWNLVVQEEQVASFFQVLLQLITSAPTIPRECFLRISEIRGNQFDGLHPKGFLETFICSADDCPVRRTFKTIIIWTKIHQGF